MHGMIPRISNFKQLIKCGPIISVLTPLLPSATTGTQQRLILSSQKLLDTSNSPSTASPDGDSLDKDETKINFVRFFAAIFMLSAGIRVIPHAVTSLVDHTIKLLDAEEFMLMRAGLDRLSLVTRYDAAKQRAIETGAVVSVAGVVHKTLTRGDLDLACRAVSVLENLVVTDHIVLLDNTRQDEIKSTVVEFYKTVPRTLATEDALHAAKRILECLDRREG